MRRITLKYISSFAEGVIRRSLGRSSLPLTSTGMRNALRVLDVRATSRSKEEDITIKAVCLTAQLATKARLLNTAIRATKA